MTADQTYDSGTDNSQPQVQPAKATQPADGYTQAGTAPDGVPVYQNGGNYYTKNADNSYTQQFQGGAPSWLNPQGQPPQQSGGSGAPSYYNASDPVHQAVWQAYQAKGIQPRDQADFQYWVDHINQSGGLANGYANTGGSGTWAQRMAAGSGGVGDYSTGGGGSGAGGGVGGWGGAGGPDPRSQALYDQLLKRSTQSLAVNPNDPIIKGQTDAFNTTQQRQLRKGLSAAAEAAGPNGNIANETRMGNESAGEATAGFQANLMQKEVEREKRRERLPARRCRRAARTSSPSSVTAPLRTTSAAPTTLRTSRRGTTNTRRCSGNHTWMNTQRANVSWVVVSTWSFLSQWATPQRCCSR